MQFQILKYKTSIIRDSLLAKASRYQVEKAVEKKTLPNGLIHSFETFIRHQGAEELCQEGSECKEDSEGKQAGLRGQRRHGGWWTARMGESRVSGFRLWGECWWRAELLGRAAVLEVRCWSQVQSQDIQSPASGDTGARFEVG